MPSISGLRSITVTAHKKVGDHVEYEITTVVTGADGAERSVHAQHRYSAFEKLHRAVQPQLPSLPTAFPVPKATLSDAARRVESLNRYLGTVCAAVETSGEPPAALLHFLHAEAEPSDAPADVRLLTFNLGLLRLQLFGVTAFGSPPFTAERFRYIPQAILACGADIVALQEIYERGHVAALLEAVAAVYPYHARADNQRVHQFHNGLLYLSRYPIDSFSLRKHAQASSAEKWLGCKSALECRIATPLGPLCFVNLHTTAGGGVDPEAQDVDTVRQSELAEAIAMCEAAAADGYSAAVIGDLNMGPEASAGNYRYMESRGYDDVIAPFADAVGCTWDPKSPLNNLQVFADCPAQRIDHFFFRRGGQVRARAAEKLFTDAPVPVVHKGGTKHVPLSDHYGLMVTLVAAAAHGHSGGPAAVGVPATAPADSDAAAAADPNEV